MIDPSPDRLARVALLGLGAALGLAVGVIIGYSIGDHLRADAAEAVGTWAGVLVTATAFGLAVVAYRGDLKKQAQDREQRATLDNLYRAQLANLQGQLDDREEVRRQRAQAEDQRASKRKLEQLDREQNDANRVHFVVSTSELSRLQPAGQKQTARVRILVSNNSPVAISDAHVTAPTVNREAHWPQINPHSKVEQDFEVQVLIPRDTGQATEVLSRGAGITWVMHAAEWQQPYNEASVRSAAERTGAISIATLGRA